DESHDNEDDPAHRDESSGKLQHVRQCRMVTTARSTPGSEPLRRLSLSTGNGEPDPPYANEPVSKRPATLVGSTNAAGVRHRRARDVRCACEVASTSLSSTESRSPAPLAPYQCWFQHRAPSASASPSRKSDSRPTST